MHLAEKESCSSIASASGSLDAHKKKTSPKTYEALDLLGFFPIDSHDGFPVGKIYENISSPYTNSGSTLW